MGLLIIISTSLLAAVLARLAWVDLRTFRLPDIYTLPLIGAGLVLALVTDRISVGASVAGALTGFGLFWAIGHFYFSRHGQEGLGLGDAKLFAASGSWLGVWLLPYVLLVASLGGLAFALMTRRNPERKVAFGPWLAFAFMTVWIVSVAGVVLSE
jgi:leader peptidase (prepilin peptidase)/N-methyltransferase